jgi:hypothetical protein
MEHVGIMETLKMIGGKAMSFISPILSIFIELFNATKQWIAVFLAYWQGKKQGRKDAIHEAEKDILDDVEKIKSARNDDDLRKRVRDKYSRKK